MPPLRVLRWMPWPVCIPVPVAAIVGASVAGVAIISINEMVTEVVVAVEVRIIAKITAPPMERLLRRSRGISRRRSSGGAAVPRGEASHGFLTEMAART